MSRNERGFLLAISCYAFRLVGSRLACVGLTEQAPPIVSADTAIHPNAHVFKMISANRRSIPINRALNSGTMIRSAHSPPWDPAERSVASTVLLVDLSCAHRLISLSELHSRCATRREKRQMHATRGPSRSTKQGSCLASRSPYRMRADNHTAPMTQNLESPALAVSVEGASCCTHDTRPGRKRRLHAGAAN